MSAAPSKPAPELLRRLRPSGAAAGAGMPAAPPLSRRCRAVCAPLDQSELTQSRERALDVGAVARVSSSHRVRDHQVERSRLGQIRAFHDHPIGEPHRLWQAQRPDSGSGLHVRSPSESVAARCMDRPVAQQPMSGRSGSRRLRGQRCKWAGRDCIRPTTSDANLGRPSSTKPIGPA